MITDFRRELSPVSLGFLVDFSGSMAVGARRAAARENIDYMLRMLAPWHRPSGPVRVRQGPDDAAADGAGARRHPLAPRRLGAAVRRDLVVRRHCRDRPGAGPGLGSRRAVVALTDGTDNASELTAPEVSGLASSIDVPVYVVIVVSPMDRDGDRPHPSLNTDQMVNGQLGNLARWTGGEIFVSLGPEQAARTAFDLVTELRQQYLIAFEPDLRPGWHPIELRTTRENLVVRTRSGYYVRD